MQLKNVPSFPSPENSISLKRGKTNMERDKDSSKVIMACQKLPTASALSEEG